MKVIVVANNRNDAKAFISEHLDENFKVIVITKSFQADGLSPYLVIKTTNAKANPEYKEIMEKLNFNNKMGKEILKKQSKVFSQR